jgi:hypothetical protein
MARLRDAMSVPLGSGDQADHDRRLEATRAALGDVAFAAAWTEGTEWPMEQAIAYALVPDPFEAGLSLGPPTPIPV